MQYSPNSHDSKAAHQDVHVGQTFHVGEAVVWLALEILVLRLVPHVPDGLIPELLLVCIKPASQKKGKTNSHEQLCL